MEDIKKKTDLELARLSGPVKQIMEVSYKAHQVAGIVVQGKIEDSSFNSVRTFNEKGIKIKEQLYESYEYRTNVFNDQRQQIETLTFNKNGTPKNKATLTYNEKGNCIANVCFNADGKLYYRTATTFNEQGKMVEHFHYMGEEEKVISHNLFEYNEQGEPLSVMQYEADEKLKHKTVYKYNDKGQKIEQASEYTDVKMVDYNSKHTYVYNEQGDCILTNVFKPDGTLKASYPQTFQYDSNGKKIVPEHVPYDPHALKEGETEINELDAHGNWIKKTTFYNKLVTNIFIRQISYYGEASENAEPFVHPLTYATAEEIQKPERDYATIPELTAEQAQWLVDTPNTSVDNFSLLRYYAMQYKEAPSLIIYTGPHIEAMGLKHELMNYLEAEEIHSYSTCWDGWEQPQRYTLAFRGKPYLLQASAISSHSDYDYEVPRFLDNIKETDRVYTSQFYFLCPSDASGKRDSYFEDQVKDYIEQCSLRKRPDKPRIRIIEVRNNNFAMVERAVDDNFQINDLDVNYGAGFEKFHNDLMHRFQTQSKGLVLFHGQPGTGKTYYIRHLLRKMASGNKKIVIYMPPNMVDHLVEPNFMTFLAGEVQRWSNEGYFSVLLIEDAEPLLAKRQEGVRIQGVTNLLNMSDGLLNDMLNLQIICTFNVDLKKLDSALLRPGRLLARKEFKPLGVLDANLLAQRLGIKHHFTHPASLAEIYTMGKNKNTLIHDVEPDQDSSTLMDDMLN